MIGRSWPQLEVQCPQLQKCCLIVAEFFVRCTERQNSVDVAVSWSDLDLFSNRKPSSALGFNCGLNFSKTPEFEIAKLRYFNRELLGATGDYRYLSGRDGKPAFGRKTLETRCIWHRLNWT